MKQELLCLLDSGGLDSRNDDLDIGRTLGEATSLAEEGNRLHPAPTGLLKSRQDIPGLTTR